MLQVCAWSSNAVEIMFKPWYFITVDIAILHRLKDYPVNVPPFYIVPEVAESAFKVCHIIFLVLAKSGLLEGAGTLKIYQVDCSLSIDFFFSWLVIVY